MAHRRIDAHQHLVPVHYADWLRGNGIAEAGGRTLPAWSADDAPRVMDAHHIASAATPPPCLRRLRPHAADAPASAPRRWRSR